MSSCVAELDSILQSMLALKPPGITGGKVSSITALCNTNIQSETVLIQRVYTHFKKAPATHKLGVLYVVDSVTRAWVEQARKAGQTFGPSAPDGTFAAGVNRVTELLPSFMTDIITNAPEDQKDKVLKLLDIWERGNTFPSAMLSGFKQRLTAPTPNDPRSTTPTATPPMDFISLNHPNANAGTGAAADTSKILKALADMAKTNTQAAGMPSQANTSTVPNLQNAYLQNMPSSVNSTPSVPPATQAVNVPGAMNGANPFAGLMSSVPNFAQNIGQTIPSGQTNMQANPTVPTGPTPAALQQQVQLLSMLQAQGVPQDQWAPLLQVLMQAGAAGGAPNAAAQSGYGGYGRDDPSRDRNGYNDQYNMRSPSGRYRDRSRSRSPGGYGRRRDSPPRRRDSPTYGDYGRGGPRRQGQGGGRDYRQRSPQDRYRRSDSPRRQEQTLPPPGPKRVEYDHALPPNHIKVLSRTLFVGGVTSSEEVLRGIFDKFGLVQTCIVNVEKRHAFVKMLSRDDSMRAKEGMERYKSAEMQLRTRWGVGFGPRDCSDYQTGISVIPIDRLTDADRKWMLTAEYGGTGGKDIQPGMVVEEPDIEIGAGVSSKAISRRMATDKGGSQGPRSTRDGPTNQAPQQRYRQPERDNHDANNIGVAPAVPRFGFQFPGMSNGFQFPPGFVMPGSTPAQPPPPGAS
ncbi:hypothetical protein ABVK25_008831 [Lepraria finkii]|uniref:RNA binding protein Nrd1 n=1 Tax=Lepraria finkii TaxID=1340010 RepID=A0ABR4B566_9LECA